MLTRRYLSLAAGVNVRGDCKDVIEKHYNENVMFALKGKIFKRATLGNDAGIYGAAKFILDVTSRQGCI